MRKPVKFAIIAAVLLAAAAAGLYYYMSPESIDVVLPERGDVSPFLRGVGKVEGESTVTVYSDVAGFIKERQVERGDRVKKGERLLSYEGEIQRDDLSHAVTDLRYSEKILKAASDNRAKYQGIYNKSLKEIENCRLVYAALEANILSLEIKDHENAYIISRQQKACQSDVYKMEGEIAEKQAELSKIEAKLKEMEITEDADEDEVDDLVDDSEDLQTEIGELNRKIADAQRAALCLPEDSMDPETYRKYATWQNNLETVTRMWSEARSDRDTAQSMLTALSEIYADEETAEHNKLNLQKAEKELSSAENGCISPVDGIITECLIDAGAYVEKGTPVFMMQSDNGYKVRMMVSKYDITAVKEGQSAEINIGGLKYNGSVKKIDQAAENDASGKSKATVEIDIDTADDLIVGLEADVLIRLDEAENILKVPSECIYSDDDGSFVYVSDGTVNKQYINVGVHDDAYTELSGIDESTRVVIDPDAAKYLGEEVEDSIINTSGENKE